MTENKEPKVNGSEGIGFIAGAYVTLLATMVAVGMWKNKGRGR